MNVEIGAEAALFPEKEYINRIAIAEYLTGDHFVPGPVYPVHYSLHFPLSFPPAPTL